jgi:hypothetical protein
MRCRIHALVVTAALIACAHPVRAQSAAVEGRVVDQQGAVVPGASITVTNRNTGVIRDATTDAQGTYRHGGLAVGVYDLRASLAGFATIEERNVVVDISAVVRVDFELRVASVAETVAVVAASPLLQVSSPQVGGVVERRRIDGLPLNGRQFANLAGTLPGVGVGFHRDPTKSSEYMPQVAGGNGRNVSYIVDGGDNTDDTVGGPLQQFPLDAIEQFRFSLISYSAEHGRASGGVLSVVTKSGTNALTGSAFDLTRHDALNARTTTERLTGAPKADYRRWQFGGALGGPVVLNKAHFFAAVEHVQQNSFQTVDTQGLFPALDGVYPILYRANLTYGKLTANLSGSDRLAVRYGYNNNGQPEGVSARIPATSWGDSRNRFQSLNTSETHVLSARGFNELMVQYATFANTVTSSTDASTERFPNGVVVGRAPDAPQATEQHEVHLRDDVSWHLTGAGGIAHDLKVGATFGYEPTLGLPSTSDPPGFFGYTHITNDLRGPLSSVGGNPGSAPVEFPTLNTPMKRFGGYVQDDWRATPRLTINAGVRYDVALGYVLDQSLNPNFVALQQAARAGRFTGVAGFESFGQTPREDYNNVQPRVGFALDVRGDRRDVIRGGWGTYTDTAFTNNSILFAAQDARGSIVLPEFFASNPNGLRKADGTFFHAGDPIATILALNEGSETGLQGEVISPRFEQPLTRQASAGWSHQLGAATSLSADFAHVDGRDLSLRLRLNSRPNGGPRRLADLPIDPNSGNFRVVTSDGRSRYDALIVALRRRTTTGIDIAASYTISRAQSLLGQAVDETGLGANTIIDATQPFAPVEYGPASSDARHRLSLSGIFPVGWGVQVAPIFYFRSALPVTSIEGVDLNGDFTNNDLPARAFAFDGVGHAARDIGACTTINCGRGASFSQFNVRVSKGLAAARGSRIDVIAEVFNVFNASNPGTFNARRLLTPSTPNPDFMQPLSFAGDFQQPEQRVGQIGVRWTFGR